MKPILILAGVLIITTSLAAAQLLSPADGSAREMQSGQRSLVGQVMDKSDAPVPNAVVYLKNTKTLAVKTFIVDKDGGYRFHALSPNIDYEVYAEYQGKKSDTKTLSSFDTRPQAYINLRLDVRR